jgi:hypothetical protein
MEVVALSAESSGAALGSGVCSGPAGSGWPAASYGARRLRRAARPRGAARRIAEREQPAYRAPGTSTTAQPAELTAQAVPLRVNVVGAAALPVWFAWNPMLVEAPGASEAL